MRRLLLLSLLGAMLPRPAAAQTACTVSATPVSFGNYSPYAASPLDSTGQVTVSCTQDSSYTITMNAGIHAGGNFTGRRMSNGQSYLAYQLYSDSTRTTIWGDGSGGSASQFFANAGTATVYGRIPPRQTVSAGTFTDTILVTISY